MWPALKALKRMGGSATNDELLAKVIELETIPASVQAIPHSDHRETKLNYNLAWAKTYLKKLGLANNSSRGVWSTTREGDAFPESDAAQLSILATRRYAEERRAKHSGPNDDAVDVLPDRSNAEPENGDWTQLLDALRALRPDAFERLAQRLLRESGFVKVEVTGRSGDGGIDGSGVLRLNLLSFQVLFQCKRYQGSVTAGVIRDFRGAMIGRSDKGLIITTGTFTQDARREATRDGAPAIDLIDGDQLCDLLKERSLGVRTEMVEQVNVEPGWFLDL